MIRLLCHLDDACTSNPCHADAICDTSPINGSYTCSCASGYKGVDCSEDIDECEQGLAARWRCEQCSSETLVFCLFGGNCHHYHYHWCPDDVNLAIISYVVDCNNVNLRDLEASFCRFPGVVKVVPCLLILAISQINGNVFDRINSETYSERRSSEQARISNKWEVNKSYRRAVLARGEGTPQSRVENRGCQGHCTLCGVVTDIRKAEPSFITSNIERVENRGAKVTVLYVVWSLTFARQNPLLLHRTLSTVLYIRGGYTTEKS
ncbi:neurogenic locus notch protein [Homalodisca vitripennis]|nr:neurogenic locus notch protein [Homalodisca vitripennis]